MIFSFFEMKNMKDAFETADRALKADPSHKAARSLWHAIKDALRPPSKSKSRESRSESSHSGRKRQSSSSRRDEHLIHQDRQASSRSKDDRERGRSSRSRGAASPAQDIHRSNVPSMPRSDTARVHTKSSEVPHSRSSTSRVDHAPHHDYHAREVRTSQEARSSGRHQRRSAPDQVSEPITSEGKNSHDLPTLVCIMQTYTQVCAKMNASTSVKHIHLALQILTKKRVSMLAVEIRFANPGVKVWSIELVGIFSDLSI